jgi:hypothetical protein
MIQAAQCPIMDADGCPDSSKPGNQLADRMKKNYVIEAGSHSTGSR